MTNDAAPGSTGADDTHTAAGPTSARDASTTPGEPERPTPPTETQPPPVTTAPPAGAGAPPWAEPPPTGVGAFTARYGLVRPIAGRQFAGVCAAIGRATNTDPVLWRVLFAVLTLFGGIGLLAYLVGWLIIPAEGDTASPVEALAGRGRSSTSPVTVILIGLLAVVVLVFIVSDGFRVAVLAAAVLVAGLLLLNRGGRAPSGPSGHYHPYGYGPPGAPGAGPAAFGAPAAPPTWAAPGFGGPAEGGPPGGAPAWPVAAGGDPASGAPAPAPGHVPHPYAPHGPYAGGGAYPPGLPPHAPPTPVPPRPPKPPHEPSRLVRVVLSLACVALGVLAVVDLTSGRVSASAYFATGLAVIGLGLLAGAWIGRARWLIPIGLALVVGLGISSGVERGLGHIQPDVGDVEWRPQAVQELVTRYELGTGDATLDLRELDFTGRDETVEAVVRFGSLRVLLPPDVDVDVRADINAGDARVLGTAWGGLNQAAREISDDGDDGPGGGHLRLIVHVNAGDLEVDR